MAEVKIINGLEYTKSNGRMKYNPEYHDQHGERWSEEDKAYLCQMKGSMKYIDISLALGRTQGVCAEKYCQIKKSGLLEHYLKLEC